MSPIRSRPHTRNPYLATMLALAAVPLAAHAADAPDAEAPRTREVVVTGQKTQFKHESANSKLTQSLRDTPQTLTVIGKDVLMDQGSVSLTEALRNTPGITLQLGENGNTSAGDTFSMRGFSAQTALFLDGIRDLGAISRDTFNIEQVEVAKGPKGADNGRGAGAGYVNLVTKTPRKAAQRDGSLTLFGAGGYRATADVNLPVTDTTAVRLNLMTQDYEIAGRDRVAVSGHGIAPSIAFGLGTDLRMTLSAQYLKADNVPDGGIPSIGFDGFAHAPSRGVPSAAVLSAIQSAPKVAPGHYYGAEGDFERMESYQLTLRVDYDLSPETRLVSTSRQGLSHIRRDLVGTYLPFYGAATASGWTPDRTKWTVSRLRQGLNQENAILANQTHLITRFMTGSVTHDLVTGFELLSERQRTDSLVAVGTTSDAALYAPSTKDTIAPLVHNGAWSEGETRTAAVYVFDTLKFSDQWSLSASIRGERYHTKSKGVTVAATGPMASVPISGDGTLVSWRVGAVYKPVEEGTLYLAVANAKTPPGSANFTLSAAETNINNPNLKPQDTQTAEAGIKWDLLKGGLSLTAAAYRTAHTHELTLDTDPANPGGVIQFGKRLISGVELGAVGQINANWAVMAGLQTMKTEVKSGSATGNTAPGAGARWSPELSATLWSTYKDAVPGLTLGGGVRYTGEQRRAVAPGTDLSTTPMPAIPSYWVADAMASYALSPTLKVQLNVYNLSDEDYIATLNNSGMRLTKGQPRQVRLSLSGRF